MLESKPPGGARIAGALRKGNIGVLPTDTLYGIVAAAANREAVRRIYDLKKRERKPGTVVAASIDQLAGLGFKLRYLKAVEHFWPGAVSIVIPCGPELNYLTQGTGAIALRVSADSGFNRLLERAGPLLTSSANRPGKHPARTIQEAELYFNDFVDFYVDGGNLSGRAPSTVIRIVDDAVEVLRQGAVRIDEAGRLE